jgi:hypothetical protein
MGAWFMIPPKKDDDTALTLEERNYVQQASEKLEESYKRMGREVGQILGHALVSHADARVPQGDDYDDVLELERDRWRCYMQAAIAGILAQPAATTLHVSVNVERAARYADAAIEQERRRFEKKE